MAYNRGYYPQQQGYYKNQQPFVFANQPRKKRSGAKTGVDKKGRIWVNAWNASRQKGLIVVSAFENSRSRRSESKSGNRFVTLMFEIMYRKTGARILELANFNVSSGKVYLEKIGMVISTKAPNGGYMGQIKRR